MIAHAFLKLGKLRLARIYVERIYSPLASYSRYSERIPLNIEPGVHTHYAKIFFVAAEISNANGDEPSAKAELTYASSLDPENLEISQRLEERMKFWTQRRKRRESKQAQQERSRARRREGMCLPTCSFPNPNTVIRLTKTLCRSRAGSSAALCQRRQSRS